MKYFKITLALLLSILFIASCGSNKKKEDNSTEAFDIDSYIKAAEAIEPNMNRVDQIFSILDMVDAEYYDVLTNDPYSAHSYKTTYPLAAANLGIYMTDIIYHLYGGAEENMFLTFAATQELARHIGIESEFASWTIENLEGTIMKRDTITMLFNNLLLESEKYSSDQEMVFVHTAFLTGSFIEKVYITSNLLKQKVNAQEISREEESNIKELLIIYLNQLEPATGILYEAFEKQQDQLEGLVVLTTFAKLKELSIQLRKVKPTLVVASVSEIASNDDLKTTFELISNLRTILIASTN
ncbi:MAG: hypothetical protein KAR19_16705 [Bacteroidales bacterium]|nr:hypothetical protein [Bacteroidales bacterium]